MCYTIKGQKPRRTDSLERNTQENLSFFYFHTFIRFNTKRERSQNAMKILEDRIRQEGLILSETVLKVDSFLNHQVDTGLALQIGQEFKRIFGHLPVNKVLTVEASGIQFAMAAGIALGVPFIYAKKKKAVTQSEEVYSAPVHSFTRQEDYRISISQKYLGPGDKVLIVDDFLATGAALIGLADIVEASGAELLGVGCVIEKSFQEGRSLLENRGIAVHALARIASMAPGEVHFIDHSDTEEKMKESARC